MGRRQSNGITGLCDSHSCVSPAGKGNTAVVQAVVGGLCMVQPLKSA